MKLFRNLLLLAAGTLVMASCLRQNTWNPYGEEEENADRVPVKMRTYLPSSSVDVKGQGALDNWTGDQEIFIYAIAREGENAAASLDRPLDFAGDGILINNVKAYSNPHVVETPGDPQEIELYFNEDTTPKELFYYDEDRRYEFFGYYVDDAATATVTDTAGKIKPKPEVGESAITLPVTIDGSQDLMLATAHKEDDNLGIGINENRMYSAYSARKGIHPNLQFDHQLARFDVRVQSGDFKTKPDLSAKLTLAKVTVDSHYDGTLYIANKQYRDNPPYLKVDESTSKPLDIWRPKDGVLSPLDETHNFKLVEGEGENMTAPLLNAGTVMVMPGQQKYKIYIGMLQDEYSSGMVEYTSEIDFSHVVAAEGLEPDTEAVAGHQYYIDVIVYGLQGVEIMVSMTKWTEAGSFILDRDREVEIYIPDDKLTLDFYSYTEGEFEPITIGATTYPNEAQAGMTYQSLNPAIASVDATGTVTPTGWGTTYIYITTPAVRDYAASTRIVTVTVLPYASIDVQGKDNTPPPIRVQLGAGTGEGENAKDPYRLNVEQPDGQNAPLTFSIADTSIATIDEHGNIAGLAVGSTTITVTAAAVKDVCREKSVTVALEVYDPNATNEP